MKACFPLIALATLPLSACSSVSLDYTDMSESPTLRDALWVVETATFPDSWDLDPSTVEFFWLSDARDACEDLETYYQDSIDFVLGFAELDLTDQDTCDSYRTGLESVLDVRPATEWELTVSMATGGAIEAGLMEPGGVGGFILSLLQYDSDLTQAYLDAVGDDCQSDDVHDVRDLSRELQAREGEVEFIEDGADAWVVDLTRVVLREPGNDGDEGMIDGDFSAERCEVDLVYPDDSTPE